MLNTLLRYPFSILITFILFFWCSGSSAFEVGTTSSGAEIKWDTNNTTFYVNTTNGPSDSLTAMRAALQTWTDVTTSSFTFNYGGTTSSTAYGVNNGINIMDFGFINTTGTVGLNTTWYYLDTGQLVDTDIRFNTHYSWVTDGSIRGYDVQNVATHELGHSLNLADLYSGADTEKTMYGYTTYGDIKRRTLDQDDIDGITYLYPLNGYTVGSGVWIRAVINTEDKGPIEAVWKKGGEATTARGDRVIWGHFYASPNDESWGSANNPDLYVKIWYDAVDKRWDVNYFHVSVPDIEVYSQYPYNTGQQMHGVTTMSRRYIRQYYKGGSAAQDESYEDGLPATGYSQNNGPTGYNTINNLVIGSTINTVEKGPISGVWRPGGTDTTARGDQVVWGFFYASPGDVSWGSAQNPDLYVKIWFDVSGRIDVNFFHVSVPDIEVYSGYPWNGSYMQKGTTIMADRYTRQQYQK